MKKKTTKMIAVILSFLLVFGACSPTGTESTQGTTEEITTETITTEEASESTEGETLSPEEQILAERRNAVVETMRSMVTVLWRAEKDIDYTLAPSAPEIYSIKAGRIYRGMPYTYACGTLNSFLEYAGEPDKNGIITVSGSEAGALSGGMAQARIGNDCSSAVTRAWSTIGASIRFNRSVNCCEDNGAIKVGEYETDPSKTENTEMTVIHNGKTVMGAAYAKLQKGDLVVRNNVSSNHMMMVVSTDVVYDKDGNVDMKKSVATILEQTRTRFKGQSSYYDEELGETVYEIGGVDTKYTFKMLYDAGYLPFTCKELVDPSTIEAPYVIDSETSYTKDSILVGTISSNWDIDAVTITVKDASGNVAQEATGRVSRSENRKFDLQKFVTDTPDSILGKVDPEALVDGQYKCVVVCRLTSGQEFMVREFEFTK